MGVLFATFFIFTTLATYIDKATFEQRLAEAKRASTRLVVLLERSDCGFCKKWSPKVVALYKSETFPLIRVDCVIEPEICEHFAFTKVPGLAFIEGNNVTVVNGSEIAAFVREQEKFGTKTKTDATTATAEGPEEARKEQEPSTTTDDGSHTFMIIIVTIGAALAVVLGLVWYYRFAR